MKISMDEDSDDQQTAIVPLSKQALATKRRIKEIKGTLRLLEEQVKDLPTAGRSYITESKELPEALVGLAKDNRPSFYRSVFESARVAKEGGRITSGRGRRKKAQTYAISSLQIEFEDFRSPRRGGGGTSGPKPLISNEGVPPRGKNPKWDKFHVGVYKRFEKQKGINPDFDEEYNPAEAYKVFQIFSSSDARQMVSEAYNTVLAINEVSERRMAERIGSAEPEWTLDTQDVASIQEAI
jgi:hypothetical protein